MRPFRTLALCLAGLLALAGAAHAQDLSGAADAATDQAGGALAYQVQENTVDAGATAAAEDAGATLAADAQASEPGDEDGVWAWFGVHLDVVMAALHELAAGLGLAAPDLGAGVDVRAAEEGVDLGLVAGDLQVERSVPVPEGRVDAAADLAGRLGLPAVA